MIARDTAEYGRFEHFSLLGGPLHRLAERLGLVRDGTNTVALGLVLGASLWVVLLLLALLEGVGDLVFSVPSIGAHVRLLVAIPLFFVCETFVDPRMARFVSTLVHSQIVPTAALPSMEEEIARMTRWTKSGWPEMAFMLLAILSLWVGPQLHLLGVTATYDPARAAGGAILTGVWYWIVCMTIFRFLLLRWLWRLGLWSFFLWRVSRLELHLAPTHPDGVGGLGYLEVVHHEFSPLVLALSAVQAASFAEEFAAGTIAFEAIYATLGLMLVVIAVLFLGPLCIFAPRLWACRIKGRADFSVFAASYVNEFERKWLGADHTRDTPMLGTPDLRSLADLTVSAGVVRDVRLVVVNLHLLVNIAAAAILPMVPLLLLKFPAQALAEKLFLRLFGL